MLSHHLKILRPGGIRPRFTDADWEFLAATAGFPSRDRWIRGELLKLGDVVSATTIATVLRQGALGPAPSRIGPTWTHFLRLQAYGLLPPGGPSEEVESDEQSLVRSVDRVPAPGFAQALGHSPPRRGQ